MIDVIIPLAGKGTRFFALSEYNKSLLPYKNKEILYHLISNLERQNKEFRFIFVVNYQKEKITEFLKNYFKDNNSNNQYVVVEQKELNGPLGAIYSCLDVITSDKLLIHLGDMILDDKLEFDKDFLGVQEVPDFSRWCMVDKDSNFYDKPSVKPNTNLALNGLYFFTDAPAFKEATKETIEKDTPLINNEYQFSQMLEKYARKTKFDLRKIKIIDVGNIDDFLKLTNFKKSRFFNNLGLQQNLFTKISKDQKILKEFYHLKLIKDLNLLDIPELYNINYSSKGIEFNMANIKGESLDFIYIFKNETLEFYENLFDSLLKKLKQIILAYQLDGDNNDLDFILYERGIEELKGYLKYVTKNSVICHGDYHLGNMILSEGKIHFVDPSGRFTSVKYYDLAKLIHSVIYDYSLVKFNLYKINGEKIYFYNSHLEDKKQLFLSLLEKYFNKEELKEAKILNMIIFKTMQSLHEEDEHKQIFEAIHKKLKKEIDSGDYKLNLFTEIEK